MMIEDTSHSITISKREHTKEKKGKTAGKARDAHGLALLPYPNERQLWEEREGTLIADELF